NAVRLASTMLYGAMFDEVDEGTAMFKLTETDRAAPVETRFLTLDADGEAVPKDWYLRLAGEAQRMLLGAPLAKQDLPFALPQPGRTP
ncbi:MAG: xylosidase, partial [Acidobacteria bacterium]|nr:xylosidase [Acidobacteriota bacterium]